MLWVVTLSLFLPSFTSSWVVCAHPSAGQELSNAAHSKIFFMTVLPRLCLRSFVPLYQRPNAQSRATARSMAHGGSPGLRNGLTQGPIAISLPTLSVLSYSQLQRRSR